MLGSSWGGSRMRGLRQLQCRRGNWGVERGYVAIFLRALLLVKVVRGGLTGWFRVCILGKKSGGGGDWLHVPELVPREGEASLGSEVRG